MDKNRILEALEILKAELNDAGDVSDEARAKLAQVSADIRKLVDEAELVPGEAVSGLQDALLEFETEHPQLTGAIGQVASALANLGI